MKNARAANIFGSSEPLRGKREPAEGTRFVRDPIAWAPDYENQNPIFGGKLLRYDAAGFLHFIAAHGKNLFEEL